MKFFTLIKRRIISMATNLFQIWQEEEDYHDWKRCLEKAIGRSDYVRVRELAEEGISFDYDFPLISFIHFHKYVQKSLC